MVNKEIIRKIVNIFPSKDLKMAYFDDFDKDIYPEWGIDDIMPILNLMFFDVRLFKLEEIIDIMKMLADNIEESDKRQHIIKIYKRLMHKGKKGYDAFDQYIDFCKFVMIKNIFKAGDLIKFKNFHGLNYGIVGNFDYDNDYVDYVNKRKYLDFSDEVYYSHTLSENIDINNPYEIYGCHDHPSKLVVERADESELNNKMKKYADFIRKNILYADSKKIFVEYDKTHNMS